MANKGQWIKYDEVDTECSMFSSQLINLKSETRRFAFTVICQPPSVIFVNQQETK